MSIVQVVETIFVPAWGWVGSEIEHQHFYHNMPFSSPSGDGLVREGKTMKDIAELFSSPLGDGLVRLSNINKIRSQRYFRPRVGMGWFIKGVKNYEKLLHFRPRVGMGWLGSNRSKMEQ